MNRALVVLWPYLLSGAVVAMWLLLLRKRLARKLQFIVVAFVACTIAGTPPPDPRNTRLRFLITAAIQVPVTLALAYYIGARTRIDRWQEP